ncbi:unnamed protein product [Leptidea sinapis]|uniref:Uncharacterized protein n=1 Tax=Leptidea sinapis TaxID=189913 RepID=A0A5E4QFS9_9NEOP|nr:unnamed protein product [Leptidea sinapis]
MRVREENLSLDRSLLRHERVSPSRGRLDYFVEGCGCVHSIHDLFEFCIHLDLLQRWQSLSEGNVITLEYIYLVFPTQWVLCHMIIDQLIVL